MKISTNGMTSSAMPNTDPASEKITISTGMSRPSRYGLAEIASVRRWMLISTAPVSCSTAKLPPITSRKQISNAPSRNPLIGDSSIVSGPR